MALGAMMYVQDYDEIMFPRCTGTWGGVPPATVYWMPRSASETGLISPYTKNYQMMICPSEPTRRGYGYNISLGYVALAKINSPASKVLFADDTFGSMTLYSPSQGVPNWGANFVNPPGSTGAAIVWGTNCPYGRHNDMVNVGFCDGHAKAMKPIELWANGVNTWYQYDL